MQLGFLDYMTVSGDTFDILALYLYGDEKMASEIMRANFSYAHVLVFDAGVKLKLPIIDNVPAVSSLPPWR